LRVTWAGALPEFWNCSHRNPKGAAPSRQRQRRSGKHPGAGRCRIDLEQAAAKKSGAGTVRDETPG